MREKLSIRPVDDGVYPLRRGNRVQHLIDGGPAFRRICEAAATAEHSLWLTVAFIEREIQLLPGTGFFDVLDEAEARGLDVRVLFWRSDQWKGAPIFHGSRQDRAFLESRNTRWQARWDLLPKGWCHHQKTWLLDAGRKNATAFVGGINLEQRSVAEPGHKIPGQDVHDIYLELQGPATTDVAHNFVQRWNGASEKQREDGHWPDVGQDLPSPTALSPEAGDVAVQITRTIRREAYSGHTPAVDGPEFEIEKGERSCLSQYVQAFRDAKVGLYIEDQAIGSYQLLGELHEALDRGLRVVYVVPGNANKLMLAALEDPKAQPFIERLRALSRHEKFTLAAMAHGAAANYKEIYVHAKIAVADGDWATVGSCNIGDRSFFSDTEMNASFWGAEPVGSFCRSLFEEQLGHPDGNPQFSDALELMEARSRDNATRRLAGRELKGLIYALDVSRYPFNEPIPLGSRE